MEVSVSEPTRVTDAARLARVVALAFEVWHDDGEAVAAFFTTPHPELDGALPLDVADSDAGAEQVTLILRRLQHGIPM